MARDWILAGHIICRGRPLNSFAVHRVANSIDPDQTESTPFAKNISKMFQHKTKKMKSHIMLAEITVCQSASFRRK